MFVLAFDNINNGDNKVERDSRRTYFLPRVWDEIKEQIELICGNKVIKYSKDFIKIKFESDDDLSLGKY